MQRIKMPDQQEAATSPADAWRTALLESSLDCVILMDATGTVLDVNRGVEETFGHARQDVVGRRLGDVFVPSEFRSRHEEGLRHYLATGQSAILGHRIEVEALHASGSRLPVELTIVRLAGATPPIFVGHLRNITERRRAERRLRLAAAAAQAITSSATAESAVQGLLRAIGEQLGWPLVQFWRVDETSRLIRRTHAWTRQPEIEHAIPVMPFRPGEGLPGAVWATGTAMWVHDLTTEQTMLPRRQALLASGLLAALAFPLRVGGEVRGVVEAFSRNPETLDPELLALLDVIGGQLSHAVAMHEARESLERANASKDEFLALISHELRTPLQPILGWAVFLEQPEVDDATRLKAARVIRTNAEVERRLVEDLLDVSRIVTGKLTIERAPVSVIHVVQSAIETVTVMAEEKAIQLWMRGDFDVPLITGDAKRLLQVFANLLVNAVKFTERGGSVSVSVTLTRQAIDVAVQDTGRGISAELLPHVFERFQQGDRGIGLHSGGLGLGLSIVRDLVAAHGGTVSAHSAGLGTGATFTVSIPTAALVQPDEGTAAAEGISQPG
ncbi:MAG: ATP-binding protein [Acidobacteriota bacterium]|nr:ATP-binding protein [Acidobacteriota bacterium]